MNKLHVLLAFCLSAVSLQAVAQKSDLPPGAMDGIGKFKDVVFPDFYGRSMTLAEADLGIGVNLGCDGSGEVNIFANLAGDATRAFNYIRGNAPGLAANYLIYSNPTAYQVYTNLNGHMNFMKNIGVASCSSIRSMASDHRQEFISQVKSECTGDGVSPVNCDNPDTLRKYVANAYENGKKAVKRAVSGAPNEEAAVRNTRERLVSLFDKQAVADSNMPAQIKAESAALRSMLVRSLGEHDTDENGKTKVVLPKSSANDLMFDESDRFRSLLIELLNSEPSSKQREKLYKDINGIPTIKSINPRVISALDKLRKNSPVEYMAQVSVLADTMAMQTLKSRTAQLEAFLKRQVSLSTKDSLFDQQEREFLARNLDALKAEITALEVTQAAKAAQAEVENQIINYRR